MSEKSPIVWSNEKRKLSELAPWDRNPRLIQDAQAERLLDSFSTFGQVLPICISSTGDIYDGHQRLGVLAEKYGPDYEVDVRVASRPLTEKEREKLTVYLHKGAAGEWNFEALFDWNFDELISWGFDDIAEIAEAAQVTEIGEAGEGASTQRLTNDKRKQVKPVIYADEVADFERAVKATGQRQRGVAVMEICRFYLEHNER